MSWFEEKVAQQDEERAGATARFAETLLKEALSPLTRLSLGLPVAMTAAEEAALERAAVRPSTMGAQEEPAPEEVPEEPTEPMEVPFEPREDKTPVDRPAQPPPAQEAEDRDAGVAPEVVEKDDGWDEPPPEISSTPPTRGEDGWIFSANDVPPMQYRDVLAGKYKGGWLEWEPETLWWAIRRDLGPLSEIARNKIMALRVCMKTNTPWIDWSAFERVAQAFNDNIPIFGLMQPPEVEAAAYAASILRTIEDWPFSAEVSGYLAAVCADAGLVYAPEEWFASAQYFIDRQLPHAAELVEQTRSAWNAARGSLTDIDWREDNPLDNQVRKLWQIAKYIEGKATATSPRS